MSAVSAAYVVFIAISALSVAAAIFVPMMHRRNKEKRAGRLGGAPKIELYNHFLNTENLKNAIAKLEIAIREFEPEYLFGVNNGGMHLATYFGNRLGIDVDKIYQLEVDKKSTQGGVHILYKEDFARPDMQNARIIIVDDVVRSGSTITTIKKWFKTYIDKNAKFQIYTLAAFRGRQDEVDYSASIVDSTDVFFPWTPEERKNELRANIDDTIYNEILNIDISRSEVDKTISDIESRKEAVDDVLRSKAA